PPATQAAATARASRALPGSPERRTGSHAKRLLVHHGSAAPPAPPAAGTPVPPPHIPAAGSLGVHGPLGKTPQSGVFPVQNTYRSRERRCSRIRARATVAHRGGQPVDHRDLWNPIANHPRWTGLTLVGAL